MERKLEDHNLTTIILEFNMMMLNFQIGQMLNVNIFFCKREGAFRKLVILKIKTRA